MRRRLRLLWLSLRRRHHPALRTNRWLLVLLWRHSRRRLHRLLLGTMRHLLLIWMLTAHHTRIHAGVTGPHLLSAHSHSLMSTRARGHHSLLTLGWWHSHSRMLLLLLLLLWSSIRAAVHRRMHPPLVIHHHWMMTPWATHRHCTWREIWLLLTHAGARRPLLIRSLLPLLRRKRRALTANGWRLRAFRHRTSGLGRSSSGSRLLLLLLLWRLLVIASWHHHLL